MTKAEAKGVVPVAADQGVIAVITGEHIIAAVAAIEQVIVGLHQILVLVEGSIMGPSLTAGTT